MALFHGTPAQTTQLSTLTPPQQQLQNQSINQALSLLQGGGFNPIEQRARTQFQTQTIPSLAERFTSMGGGAQRSSAFQGTLGQAGAGLEEALAGLRSQYEQNQLGQLLGVGLRPSVENIYQPKGQSFLGSLLTATAPALGMIGSGGLSNLFSGIGSIGSSFMSPKSQINPQQTQQIQSLISQLQALLGGR